jgi:hypothetical protein
MDMLEQAMDLVGAHAHESWKRGQALDLAIHKPSWDAVFEHLKAMQQDAYAEGRKDEAEQNAWQPLETAPEDEYILIAATGGQIGMGFWTDEGDGKVWGWSIPAMNGGEYLRPSLVPTHWMPLPKHPTAK